MTALSVFFSDKVQGTVSWMAGGFAGVGWQSVRMILPYSLIGMIGTVCLYRRLNALQLGDDVAQTLGVQVNRTRALLVALAALLAASAVSVAGLLGFVGLVVPHVMRLIVGSDFEPLLPCSAVFGAVLVAGADVAARTVFRSHGSSRRHLHVLYRGTVFPVFIETEAGYAMSLLNLRAFRSNTAIRSLPGT